MIKVGIFWVIEGRIWYKLQEKEKSNREKTDSDLSHYQEWYRGILKTKYKNKDFASFPRGRVIYDSRTSEHIIYADKCILDYEIRKIAKYFEAEKYRVCRDLHYRCDNCLTDF